MANHRYPDALLWIGIEGQMLEPVDAEAEEPAECVYMLVKDERVPYLEFMFWSQEAPEEQLMRHIILALHHDKPTH